MNNSEIKKKIPLHDINQLDLLGYNDSNLKKIQEHFDAKIVVRGGELILIGDETEVALIERLFEELFTILEKNDQISENDIVTIAEVLKTGVIKGRSDNDGAAIIYTKDGSIKPKTSGQKRFYQATQDNDIVFVVGPAGTGKTYLAVAIALSHLRDKLVDKLVLARPAVEAGESLGFLPGDLREKVDPYLKPLYDALFDMVIPSKLKKYMENGIIEIVPLAYMRGRTLNNAFVILDEAQNTNPNQMKMFLTRLGINSKAIITGDITQIDLPFKTQSGLIQIQNILNNIDGIDFVYLKKTDVVRHRLVKQIISAYEKYDQLEQNNKKETNQ